MRPCLVPTVLLAGCLAACGDPAPATPPTPAPVTSAVADSGDARIDLAARAALAQDHRFAALYTWTTDDGRDPRTVVATVAADGSWRVDIPGGALGGTADVSIVQNSEGVFQCSLPSATYPVSSGCVRVADPGGPVPKDYDPKVERLFRQWLSVFTDRQSPLSVVPARPLPGTQNSPVPSTCFSIDSISASLTAPVDVGIYCYADNGLLTAARVSFGTLTLQGAPAAPPPRVDLPGAVIGGAPMGMATPPPPPVVEPSAVGSSPAQ